MWRRRSEEEEEEREEQEVILFGPNPDLFNEDIAKKRTDVADGPKRTDVPDGPSDYLNLGFGLRGESAVPGKHTQMGAFNPHT